MPFYFILQLRFAGRILKEKTVKITKEAELNKLECVSLQTRGFYEWNKHCEWPFTFGIIVHPIEHNCKDSSVTLGRDVDKETTQTSWIGTDQEVAAYNKTVQ